MTDDAQSFADDVAARLERARWSIRVDPVILDVDPAAWDAIGFPISGDHRPREPRYYDAPFLPAGVFWNKVRHPRRGAR